MSISRRTALATGAAALTTAAIATPLAFKAAGVRSALAGDAVNEPLLAMEQEWLAYRDYCNNHPDESDEARERLYEPLYRMEEIIFRIPAKTPAGVAVKVRLFAHYYTVVEADGLPWWEGDIKAIADPEQKWLGLVMRDLERLAGGLPS